MCNTIWQEVRVGGCGLDVIYLHDKSSVYSVCLSVMLMTFGFH